MDVFLDWPVLSRDAALAWQARESRRCRCGQIPADWRTYDNNGLPVFDEHGAHVADPLNKPFNVAGEFCPACYELEQAEKQAPKVDGAPSRAWVLRMHPNPDYVPVADKLLGLVSPEPDGEEQDREHDE